MDVTGMSLSQVASMLKEMAAFLKKLHQLLFGKDFRHNLTESLKTKKQSVKLLQKLINLPTERGPFEKVPHFIKKS